MDFSFSAHETRLRKEIGDFARRELPAGFSDGAPDFEQQFQGMFWDLARELMPKAGANGWLGPNWPTQYGGKGGTAAEQVICYEEMAYWGIPGSDMGVGGISWIGPSLLSVGSEAQKLEHLPPLAQGRRFWCTAYSEPGSGSDMASLQSTATRKGDVYVINGQKVWTSSAPVADWCWLLVRTDPNVPKHRGLSLFVLDLRTRGVTVKPLYAMTGTTPFAEIFLDDVIVPKTNLVGQENRGWNYVVSALEYERASVGVLFAALTRRILDDIVRNQKDNAKRTGAVMRHKIAELAIEAEVSKIVAYRAAIPLWAGNPSNVESALSKVFSTEASLRAVQLEMESVGLLGLLSTPEYSGTLAHRAHLAYLSSVGNTILAGTSEIERNVIARRGLALPGQN